MGATFLPWVLRLFRVPPPVFALPFPLRFGEEEAADGRYFSCDGEGLQPAPRIPASKLIPFDGDNMIAATLRGPHGRYFSCDGEGLQPALRMPASTLIPFGGDNMIAPTLRGSPLLVRVGREVEIMVLRGKEQGCIDRQCVISVF